MEKLENENILETANKITSEDRQEQYGHPKDSMTKAAIIASEICNKTITAQDVAKIQIALKLARQSHKAKTDNLVDLCGYAWVLSKCD